MLQTLVEIYIGCVWLTILFALAECSYYNDALDLSIITLALLWPVIMFVESLKLLLVFVLWCWCDVRAYITDTIIKHTREKINKL